ncbi:MAG TPA: SIMPL domain-containing protein [Anaerolineales bacterium]|nr:SIMPL domain-containing protein [Anaerolineales bacterium]
MESATENSTVSVTGSAIIVRQPDIAYIALYVRMNGILLEDAIRDATNKLEQISTTLKNSFPEIKEIQPKDIYVGESKSYSFMAREKAEPPQPEVIKGLLVLTSPHSDLTTKIVDTASRMGCIIQNPTDPHLGSYPRGVVLYGLADYEEAEQEALENAITDAKENASKAARILNKQINSIKEISSVETLRMKMAHDETIWLNRNIIVFPTSYLSVSPQQVEVSVKVSVTFELVNDAQ